MKLKRLDRIRSWLGSPSFLRTIACLFLAVPIGQLKYQKQIGFLGYAYVFGIVFLLFLDGWFDPPDQADKVASILHMRNSSRMTWRWRNQCK
jgi:hypothetical protein